MKKFNASTYQEKKGSFNNEDEQLLLSLMCMRDAKGNVLDVGCGDGKLTVRVKEVAPGAIITAIDNSPEQIALTQAVEGVHFECADVVDFSPDTVFDTVYSFYAFPHIPKSRLLAALTAVRRLLQEGGRFYFFTNICLFDTIVASSDEQEACDIVFLNEWPSQINLVSMEEMRSIFKAAGFREMEDRRLKTGAAIKTYGEMVSWLFILE